MANLIKVEQVEHNKQYSTEATARNILRTVFGEEVNMGWHGYKGVEFHAMREGSSYSIYGNRLTGIQMSVGSYGHKTIRKVMVTTNGMIDADTIKAKFAELKQMADDLAEQQQQAANRLNKAEQLRDKIAKLTNHPDRDFDRKVQMRHHSPEAISLRAKVNGTQLTAIERLLGEQKLPIHLTVPEDKAVEVYNILNS